MSDTKTTTDDERLAWELACAEEEQPSAPFDEWSRKDRAKMLRIVAKARELLAPADVALEPLRFADKVSAHADELRAKLTRRPAESGTVATRCTVYATPCSVHDFIHGAEAEELREGIEKLMENEDAVKVRQLRSLLDRVDARDSLAYLESHEAQHGERRTVAGERPAGKALPAIGSRIVCQNGAYVVSVTSHWESGEGFATTRMMAFRLMDEGEVWWRQEEQPASPPSAMHRINQERELDIFLKRGPGPNGPPRAGEPTAGWDNGATGVPVFRQPPEAAPHEVTTADDLDSATVWALAEALSKRFMWNGQHSKKVAIEALLFLGDEAELRGQLLKAEQDLKELEGAFHQSISTGVERAEALARQAEAHERKLGAVKSDLKLWTEKLDEAERRLRIVNTDIEGVWFWQGDGHDDPVSLACPVVMSADTLREMVAQAEAHAREAQLTVARLIEDLAKKAGCLVTRLDTKKQGSK